MTERLFSIDEIPEVPLFRPPRRSRGERDARFRNDYPPDWHQCQACQGDGWGCAACLGTGSLKARVRLEAGHRCVRCQHPYIPKGDARMLGRAPSWQDDGWSACDDLCEHQGPIRYREAAHGDDGEWRELDLDVTCLEAYQARLDDGPHGQLVRFDVEAQWRILTVHHLDGDKANCRWWNLASLCQRCHLEIQAKVVMERIYPYEHTVWFRPFVAGYYGWVYLGEDLTRVDVDARLDELLALERSAA